MKNAARILSTALVSAALAGPVLCPAQDAQDASRMPRWLSIAADTNAAAVTSNAPYEDREFNAWADTFILELGGTASPTCTVKLVTMDGSDVGAARTLLTLSATTGGVFPLRDLVTTAAGVDIANTPARMPIFSRLRVEAYAANTTGVTAKAYCVTTDKP